MPSGPLYLTFSWFRGKESPGTYALSSGLQGSEAEEAQEAIATELQQVALYFSALETDSASARLGALFKEANIRPFKRLLQLVARLTNTPALDGAVLERLCKAHSENASNAQSPQGSALLALIQAAQENCCALKLERAIQGLFQTIYDTRQTEALYLQQLQVLALKLTNPTFTCHAAILDRFFSPQCLALSETFLACLQQVTPLSAIPYTCLVQAYRTRLSLDFFDFGSLYAVARPQTSLLASLQLLDSLLNTLYLAATVAESSTIQASAKRLNQAYQHYRSYESNRPTMAGIGANFHPQKP